MAIYIWVDTNAYFCNQVVKALRPEMGLEAGPGSLSVCGAAAGESKQPVFLYFDKYIFLYFFPLISFSV